MMMRVDILSLFPTMFVGPLQESMVKRAQQRGLLTIVLHQIRDYAFDRHQMTDDAPYGGGHGMVMKPEPIFRAVRSILGIRSPQISDRGEVTPVILMTPQGRRFDQTIAQELAQYPRLLFICGHYEGVDERVRQHVVTHELSIGDYVLTGGELAAMVVVDAVARMIPGVLGASEAASHDSFASASPPLLEGPHYTRPVSFEGLEVPDVLLSGHHARIRRWRHERALHRTWGRRPDLLAQASLTDEDRDFIDKLDKS
jgi:tRNA (guanine37-N1)-methyltransferase